jgi:hypothetical protein
MIKIILLLLLLAPLSYADSEKPVYVFRDPVAWGAIYKYCVACHGADLIDRVEFNVPQWSAQVDWCMLRARSSGYPIPTSKERQALKDFLPQVTPKNRQPPVYMVRPKRGSLAY